MPVTKCWNCRAEIQADSAKCPKCSIDAPQAHRAGYCALLIIAVVGLTMVSGAWWLFSGSSGSSTPSAFEPATTGREATIRQELRYLTQEVPGLASGVVKEIAWIDVSSNNVYIGFSSVPADMSFIIRGAAIRCNRAINVGCHVWALPANSKRPWRGGDGPYFEEVTARNGRVE